jgi:predicted nucleic acid-binding protein
VIAVDTSVVVRYLVGTPTDQAARAARLIDGPETVAVSLVVLVETAHVLRTQYGVARADVVDALLDLVRREDVAVLGMTTADTTDALVRARSQPGRPIPDALIAIAARAAGALPLVSFDRTMARYGVAVTEP